MSMDLIDRADAPTVPAVVDEHVSMFERLAKDPTVPVEKLERLIELQRSILRDNAKAEFDAAFAQMQGEIPIITERGEIAVNGQVRSKYARLEDILEVVRPILSRHGFAIRHRNEFSENRLKIIGILSHRSGHSEQDEFEAKADVSGSKNDIQALGSTRSYGQRYTTISLLGIATKGEDDDGRASEKRPEPPAPAGFDSWWTDMQACADQGMADLTKALNASKVEFRNHMMATRKEAWWALKAKAAKVSK